MPPPLVNCHDRIKHRFSARSAFILANDIPRVRVWKTETIKAYIASDQNSGDNNFGNLPIKHIRSTPFHSLYSQVPVKYNLLEDVQKFIQDNYGKQEKHFAMSQFHSISECLYRSMVTNLLPVISNSVDNMARVLCQRRTQAVNFEDSDSDAEDSIPALTPHEFNKLVNEFPYLEVPKITETDFCNDEVLELLEGSEVNPDSSLVQLHRSADYEELLSDMYPKPIKVESEELVQNKNSFIKDFLYLEHRVNEVSQKDKEKLVEWREDTKFLTEIAQNQGSSKPVFKGPPTKKISSISQNERFLAHNIPPVIGADRSEDLISENRYNELPSFSEIWKGNSSCSKSSGFLYGGQPWNENMESQCRRLEHQYNLAELEGFKRSFVRTSELINQEKITPAHERLRLQNSLQQPKQTVRATKMEEDLFTYLSANIVKCTVHPCIFQLNETWVDQRTLWFSMKFGGWINNYVMDSFRTMFLHEQQVRRMMQDCFPGQFLIYMIETKLSIRSNFLPDNFNSASTIIIFN